ncbi:hypothetical protein VTI74DRAFT_2047 [Chaetomium olivicolor]
MLLQPSVERDDAEIEALDLSKMDEDPLVYFLTPAPSSYPEDEGMDFDMDFDAGIEDSKHPPPIVRSISPSNLSGFGRPPPRPPTPPKSPGTPDLEYDLSSTPDEHEEYDYMDHSWPPLGVNPLSLPRRMKEKFKTHPKHDAFDADGLVPPRTSSSSPRGRAASRLGPKPVAAASSGVARTRRSRTMPSRLSPHAWREPSPDVWSIEEEAEEEEEEGEEMKHGQGSEIGGSGYVEDGKVKAVDIPAAKPEKRVRFVLPGEVGH